MKSHSAQCPLVIAPYRLRRTRYLREQTKRYLGPIEIANHPVFRLQLFNQNFSGFGLTKWQLNGFFRKLSTLSGIKVSAHRLRHTFATLIAQSGENPDLKLLQYILGHTDIRTTMAYIEPQKKHLQQVMNQLKLNTRLNRKIRE